MRVAVAIVDGGRKGDAPALGAGAERGGPAGAAGQDCAGGREGKENKDIAVELGTLRKTVGLWRQRFASGRLAGIEQDTPDDVDLHLIADNYATHKHPQVQRWLARHPRFHMHFTPTSSSWLNLVERWFREITQQRIRRGVFTSVKQLKAAIYDYIDEHNEHAKGFAWTATPDEILAKVRRARAALDKTPSA